MNTPVAGTTILSNFSARSLRWKLSNHRRHLVFQLKSTKVTLVPIILMKEPWELWFALHILYRTLIATYCEI